MQPCCHPSVRGSSGLAGPHRELGKLGASHAGLCMWHDLWSPDQPALPSGPARAAQAKELGGILVRRSHPKLPRWPSAILHHKLGSFKNSRELTFTEIVFWMNFCFSPEYSLALTKLYPHKLLVAFGLIVLGPTGLVAQLFDE